MDDGKLRALLTAVECGSFSKAAAQLGYTQSAMTHLVNKLEAEVGCTLLERDSQGHPPDGRGQAAAALYSKCDLRVRHAPAGGRRAE